MFRDAMRNANFQVWNQCAPGRGDATSYIPKNFLTIPQIRTIFVNVRALQEGRFAIVTTRWAQDAMGAAGSNGE